MPSPSSSLWSFICASGERTQNKDPAQYLLTTEQMVENDYPVPSYLADVFQKPEGWIETPQVVADEEGFHLVYAVDCEMVHILTPCNSQK